MNVEALVIVQNDVYNTRILQVEGVDIRIIDIIVISIFIVNLVSKFQSSYCAFENNVMWYVVVIMEVCN
jgi:hypothetical protein